MQMQHKSTAYAGPNLFCIVSRRSDLLVGGVFDPVVSSAKAVCGCGQRQCTPSRQQVARDETEEPLIPLSFPTRSLSCFSLQIGKVSAACSCCQLHLHWERPVQSSPVQSVQCECIRCYGHATSLVWMQQSLGMTESPVCFWKKN